MKNDNVIGYLIFMGLGLWLVIIPESVIKFYSWFHKNQMKLPSLKVIRIIGLMIVLLLTTIFIYTQYFKNRAS